MSKASLIQHGREWLAAVAIIAICPLLGLYWLFVLAVVGAAFLAGCAIGLFVMGYRGGFEVAQEAHTYPGALVNWIKCTARGRP